MGKVPLKVSTLRLQVGSAYLSKDGEVWLCFRLTLGGQAQAEAHCIRVSDSRVEYFYLDGRYDTDGKREHTLVKETTLPGRPTFAKALEGLLRAYGQDESTEAHILTEYLLSSLKNFETTLKCHNER